MVVVEIVQKNDRVLVEMMMMMDSFFFFFSLYPGQGEVLNYLDNLFGGGRRWGDGRLQVIVFNEFMSIPGV